jgi:hypothetical protein
MPAKGDGITRRKVIYGRNSTVASRWIEQRHRRGGVAGRVGNRAGVLRGPGPRRKEDNA